MSVDSANDTLLHPEKLRCYCVSLPPPLLRGCLSPKVPVGVLPARTSAVLGQVLAATPQVFPAARQRGLETEADGVVSIFPNLARACLQRPAPRRVAAPVALRAAGPRQVDSGCGRHDQEASRGAAFRAQSVRMQVIFRKLLISWFSLWDSNHTTSSLPRKKSAGLTLDFSLS